jgi:hypothetical protein
MIGRRSRPVGVAVLVALLVLLVATGWIGWLVWAALLLVLGVRHPTLDDPRPLGWKRQLVGVGCFAVFLACFVATPVSF